MRSSFFKFASQKMATVNTLFDDFLSSDVDESAISALVGSLENQLASPTSKEHTPQNSSSVNSNHIGSSHIGSGVPIQPISVSGASPLAHAPKPASQQTTSQTVNPVPAVIKSATQHQIIGINSVVSAAPLHTNSPSAQRPNVNSAVKITNSQNHPAIKIENQPHTIISSNKLPGQVIITLGSSNTGTVHSTKSVNSIHAGMTFASTNGLQGTGSLSSGVSSNYNLANVAAGQQSVAIPNPSQMRPGHLTVHEQLEKQKATIDGNSVPKSQFVIKQESPQMNKQLIKQETNIKPNVSVKQENISPVQVLSQSNTSIKSASPSTPGVITVNKPQTTRTITVLKPNSAVTSVPHSQIQIINSATRPSAMATAPKTLAPRMVNSPIRIAPQHIVNVPRPQGGIQGATAVTLPPGFQLPPGTVLVKNEHGQIVMLSGQQAAGIQPQPAYKLQTVKRHPAPSQGPPPRVQAQQPLLRHRPVSPESRPSCMHAPESRPSRMHVPESRPSHMHTPESRPSRVHAPCTPCTQQPYHMYTRHPPSSCRMSHGYSQQPVMRTHLSQGHHGHMSHVHHQPPPIRQQLVTPVAVSSSPSPRLSTHQPVVTMTPQVHSSPQTTVVRPVVTTARTMVQQAAVSQNGAQKPHTATTLTPTQPNIPQTVVSITGQPATTVVQQPPLNQNMMDNVKKCKNFLSTLIKLASNQPATTVKNVKGLIQGLIDGNVEPEIFTEKLQIELKSSPQPYLVPFLKKSLPLLRHCLSADKLKIEGVRPPPVNSRVSVVTIPSSRVQPAAPTPSAPAPIPQTVQMANSTATSTLPNHTKMRQMTVQQLQQYRLLQAQNAVRHAAAGKVSAVQTKTLLTRPALLSAAGAALAPATVHALQGQVSRSPVRPVHSSAVTAGHPSKRKCESLKDDDDINDVATMGGVNLTEESRNILATNSELVGTQHRSCKDENFLFTGALLSRINSIVRKHGLEDVPQEVANIISHATQERLKRIAERLSVIAEHRLEIYKNDSRYEVKSAVKPQIKFLEELDKLEKKRHEEQEREVLLRAAKSRSKHEDPEQLKLKQKAKEMQQAELEITRQREANLTALAAIGPRKKRKTETGNQSQAGTSGASGTGTEGSTPRASMMKPRMKRVNLRDLMFLMEQDRETTKSPMLYKAFLK